MSSPKKSKFMSEDLDYLNGSEFLNGISKKKRKASKRQTNAQKEFVNPTETKPTAAKKVKNYGDIGACGESRQKSLNVMNQHLEARKQMNENLLKNLSEFTTNFESDYDAIKENEKKLEHLTGCFIMCMQQTTAAFKENRQAFVNLQATFKKETEGLLLRGAIKPDDRPLWFDVYRAFPPATEPKYARPKPENKPLRQILYKEDLIRAKFHAKGLGLTVSMLGLSGETHIKKLVQKYQQLQAEGVAEEELIQKSAEAVDSERQPETPKMTPKNPDSVTAKVMADADLIKNIFKE